MVVDYRQRITIDEALEHSYLKELHCPEDELIKDVVSNLEFEFEKYPLSLQQLKDLVYEELLLYHFEDFRKGYFKMVQAGENPCADVIHNENASKGDQESDDEN